MTKLISFLIIQFCLFSIPGMAQDNSPGGSEAITKQERAIQPFETLIVTGGGNVYLYHASSATLQLKGENSCTDGVEVSVSSKTLHITTNDNSNNCNLEIHIGTPGFKEIQQNGGGMIEVKEGFAPMDAFTCTLNGGGIVKMTSVNINSLFASIKGGGEVSVQVDELLHGKIRGGGRILCQGNPTIESDISGGGEIKLK